MDFSQYFPIWNKLTDDQRQRITQRVMRREVKKGTLLHDGSNECTGLLLVRAGQLRAYILSDEGREITIYRLFDRDMCLFSASCIMRSIQFDITVEAEKDTELWLIPPDVYQSVMNESAAVANYTNEVMASRFSEVMWLMEQIMWKSLDKRLAAFLAEESAIEGSDIKVGKINIEDEQALAREFRVMSIPTLLVVKNGQVVNRSVGVKSKSAILNML